jgi:DNA-directed RNA polymerase subunit beta
VVLLKNQSNRRISFGKIPEIIDAPDLLNIQLESWESFLQSDVSPSRRKNKGLQAVFKMNFPITDARENFLLEFVEYYVEKAKYSVGECEEGLLPVPLKANSSLAKAEDGKTYAKTIEQDVYLGSLPTMTIAVHSLSTGRSGL